MTDTKGRTGYFDLATQEFGAMQGQFELPTRQPPTRAEIAMHILPTIIATNVERGMIVADVREAINYADALLEALADED